MGDIVERIELQTHDPEMVLRFLNVTRGDLAEEFICQLVVRAAGFGCDVQFRFDQPHLEDAIRSLQKMEALEPGEAVIAKQWLDSFIRYKLDDLGHLFVSGTLHQYGDLSQSLSFALRTDQTVLAPLIRDLRRVAAL